MGSTVCADDQHKFHHFHQLCAIDVPRRCRTRRVSPPPRDGNGAFSRFLPSGDDTDDDDPYASDHFRMYEFKIRKCNRSRSHDWTDCPFAHPGEKARRRDPRRFRYSGAVCPDFRRAGHCARADACSFAHGVFECWLHPTRYRTEACKDGRACNRKVCFFAHSARQLRCPPPESRPPEKTGRELSNSYCCAYCHSPTSTLTRTSPPLSPPEYGCGMGYKEAVVELIANLEAMNLSRGSIPVSPGNLNLPWVDVNFGGGEEQPQFVMSPSTPPSERGYSRFLAGESKLGQGDGGGRNLSEESFGGPDLGWVNDLLT